MAPLIQAALSLGPTVLRMLGQSKGGNVAKVTGVVADLIDSSNGNPPPQSVQAELDKLTPAELSAISVDMARIAAEREKTRLNYDAQMHTQQQETIRSSKDLKGVRPAIADRHSWFVCVYILGAELTKALGYGTGASVELAVAIATPTLAYFGFRTWDKFSPQGASAGAFVSKFKITKGG